MDSLKSNSAAEVRWNGIPAGILKRHSHGFIFRYYPEYLERSDARPVAVSFPLTNREYESSGLFPFFAGLAPEGWLLRMKSMIQKIDEHDLFGLLLENGEDLIGAVSIHRRSAS